MPITETRWADGRKKYEKNACVITVIFIVAVTLTACSSPEQGGDTAPGAFKTIGDLIRAANVEEKQSGQTDDYYVYVYEQDGTYYRAVAVLSREVSAQLAELDFFADDYEDKRMELISPLTIDRLEHLSETLPAQAELDQWIGKTGKDLFDAGWTNSGWNLDDMVFGMNYGAFQYDVIMEGEVKNADEFSDEDINSPAVKSVTFNGQLGDATEIGE